ncbi:MAG: ATP-binding protein [Pseudomonadota bacterium]
MTGKRRVLLSWSSGKDSAWTLHTLRRDPDVEVIGLITSFNQAADRVAMHAVRRTLVERQAAALGLPLHAVELPWPCSNAQYESAMQAAFDALAGSFDSVAFGDLFLEDIRAYRVAQCQRWKLTPEFPVWGQDTTALAQLMIESGIRAVLTCVDPQQCPREWAGQPFDAALLDALPASVDHCGENGEFHSFVVDSPDFAHPIAVRHGEVVERDGFVFADLEPA